jgi:RNA polymerase sigma-70 factor (ECF subfamily)
MPRFDTLHTLGWSGMFPLQHARERFWSKRRELDKFLAEIERRAFRMAQVALARSRRCAGRGAGCHAEAGAQLRAKPSAEWRPLFYRILENGIRDLQRRRTVRKKFMVWLPGAKEDPDNEAQDPLENVADGGSRDAPRY